MIVMMNSHSGERMIVLENKGKWVVDYGDLNFPDHIQHKEFDIEEEAIVWGKSQVGKTFTVEGWPQAMPIKYLHMVYEPVWHDANAVPIEEVFTNDPTPADHEGVSEQTEANAPANDVGEEVNREE